jgi:HSP20 family molecular chaperone IbpA
MQFRRRDPLSERQSADRRWVVQGYMVFRPNSQFTPPTDVVEFDDKVLVRIEIAGMKASDFSVSLTTNQLIVSGTRERPSFPGGAYHQVEIGYGDFRVEVGLPWPVDEDDVSAAYREGFLQIELPRRAERAIRIIDVNTAEEGTTAHDE